MTQTNASCRLPPRGETSLGTFSRADRQELEVCFNSQQDKIQTTSYEVVRCCETTKQKSAMTLDIPNKGPKGRNLPDLSFAYFGFCSRIPWCNFTMLPKVKDRRNLSASTLEICHDMSYYNTYITLMYMEHIPVVPHKAVAKVSKIGNL